MFALRSSSSALFVFLLGFASAQAQSTWYVDVNGVPPGNGTPGDPYTSIQYAIDQPATADGDTVLVAAGRYLENVVLDGKGLTLRAPQGPEATVIDGTQSGRVFTFFGSGTSASRLEGFTLTNGAGIQGGGVGVYSGAPEIVGCHILGNTASQTGGGLDIKVASPTLSRCVVADNTAQAGAGVYSFYGFDFLIEHCSIYGNTASAHGGGILNGVFCDPEIVNTIVWGNVPDSIHVDIPSDPIVSYSDIEGGWGGIGNIESDPLFWGADEANFYLQPGSPCVNSGDPDSPPDPDGSRADMGAIPADSSKCGPTGIFCAAKVNSLGCVPAIEFSGTPSATGGAEFRVEARDVVNNKLGILLYGYDWQTVKFQGGLLCLRPPIRRTVPQSSGGNPPPNDCSGTFSLDFNALIQGGQDPNLAVGSTNYAQYWYRDGGAAFGTGLTDAVRFTICP